MNKKTLTLRLLVCLLSTAAAGSALADSASINYRHQFLDDDRMHSDRVKLSYRMDNGLGFEGELKYRTAGDRKDVAFDNTVSSGHELTTSYQYKYSAMSTWQPAIQLDSNENGTTYKFGLKYTRKLSDQFYVAARYRFDALKLNRDRIDEDVPDRGSDNRNTQRYEGWLGYTPAGKLSYEYQYIYFDTDYIRYDNKKSDYEQNLAVKYKLDKYWAPFIEIGDIKVSATDDDRQLRFRIGVQYNFM